MQPSPQMSRHLRLNTGSYLHILQGTKHRSFRESVETAAMWTLRSVERIILCKRYAQGDKSLRCLCSQQTRIVSFRIRWSDAMYYIYIYIEKGFFYRETTRSWRPLRTLKLFLYVVLTAALCDCCTTVTLHFHYRDTMHLRARSERHALAVAYVRSLLFRARLPTCNLGEVASNFNLRRALPASSSPASTATYARKTFYRLSPHKRHDVAY